MNAEWGYVRDDNSWVLLVDGVRIEIATRPGYCDRGRHVVVVSGLGDLDEQDAFPRYFMDLTRAKQEMVEWIGWRLRVRELPTEYGRWNVRTSLVAEFGALLGALRHAQVTTDAETAAMRALLEALRTRIGAHND